MLIPYQVEVPMTRWPVANFALIAVISLVSLAALADAQAFPVEAMILDGWSPSGMLGHIFLHADLMHLFGNMVFLWVFGNAVCAKFGNIFYVLLFFVVGLSAAAAHNTLDGGLAVGASGAINGVVGMFLILFPRNDISCFYIFIVKFGTFTVSSIWMILFWLVFDIWGAALGGAGVAYWAHLGGFAAGAVIAVVALKTRLIKMARYEESLLDALAG